MDKKVLQDQWLQLLAEDGFNSQLDDDGDIWIRFEGRDYHIIIDEEDERYFRITHSWFYKLENETEKSFALTVCSDINRKFKIGKLFLVGEHNENITASIEMYIPTIPDIKPFLVTLLSILQAIVRELRTEMETMKETEHEGEAAPAKNLEAEHGIND